MSIWTKLGLAMWFFYAGKQLTLHHEWKLMPDDSAKPCFTIIENIWCKHDEILAFYSICTWQRLLPVNVHKDTGRKSWGADSERYNEHQTCLNGGEQFRMLIQKSGTTCLSRLSTFVFSFKVSLQNWYVIPQILPLF